MRNQFDSTVGVQTSSSRDRRTTIEPSDDKAAKVALPILPIASFLMQYVFSARAGTQSILLHHPTVTFLDWIFVPFNYYVVGAIDWQRGARMFVLTFVSLVMNILTHAYWQYHGLDTGHMITRSGFVLPAGWVHLAFSTVEMTILLAFVFSRRAKPHHIKTATTLATIYFVGMAFAGYAIHGRLILSDAIAATAGLFFLLIYPRLRSMLV